MAAAAGVAALVAGDAAAGSWPSEEVLATDSAAEPKVRTAPEIDHRARTADQPTRFTERPPIQAVAPSAGTAVADPIPTERRFLTEDLNLRTEPSEDAKVVDVLEAGSKVRVTGRVVDGYAEVVVDGKLRWVTAEYLSKKRPATDGDSSGDSGNDSGGLSDAPCPRGSDIESGLSSNAIAVYRAVCAEFPEVTSYGGLRPGDDGEHGTGHALDIMIPDSATGDAIADFVQDNYQALGVSEIIWAQHIWTVERASEGWRPMEDRGSDTANHYDHVHVTVY